MITYHIDRTAHLVTCEVTIGLRVLDIGTFVEQLFSDAAFDGSLNILVVVDSTTVAPDIIARNALATLLLSWRKLHAPAKCGLVLAGSAWRRIATQLIEDYDLAPRNVCCFSQRTEALRWLQEPAAASQPA